MAFQSVQSLVLNLQGSPGSGSAKDLRLSLWDFEEQDWHTLTNLQWGSFQVENPDRYVNQAGAIFLNLEANTIANLQVDRVDFTLVVRR